MRAPPPPSGLAQKMYRYSLRCVTEITSQVKPKCIANCDAIPVKLCPVNIHDIAGPNSKTPILPQSTGTTSVQEAAEQGKLTKSMVQEEYNVGLIK